MDRELVLAVLVALGCGGALSVAGSYPAGRLSAASGRALERRAWRRLWLPFGPAVLLLAALCGWALVEPACAERVPGCLVWGAVPFAAIVTRAVWRGAGSLRRPGQHVAMGTVGFWRPRILMSGRIAEILDVRALAAALAHERAHARHRDPLRLWLARLASDLLWPWPAAEVRLRCWTSALELARDEEARLGGVAGPDLAAALLGCLRVSGGHAAVGAVTLGGDAAFLRERIARLLRPVEAEPPAPSARALWLIGAAGVVLAGLGGSTFGERVVRTLFALV